MSSELQHPFIRPGGRPSVSVIIPGEILIASYPRAVDAGWLHEEHGVQAVLSLQDDWDLLAKSLVGADLEAAYAAAGIDFLRIPITDNDLADVRRNIDRVVKQMHIMRARGDAVLVHCNAGYNRAPTVVIAYLNRHCGMALREAEAFVRQRRSCAPYTSVLE
ncbi:MAG: dual specificity protein phosphatase family protein [Deltaproteobacteria bacterium]